MSSPAPGAAWRACLWLLLGGWVGSWAAFGLVFTPALFAAAPDAAGGVIRPTLAALHLYGGAAGLALAALAFAARRGRLLVGLPLALSAVCFTSHFGISAEIAELGDRAFGAGGSQELAARFNHLHRISVALFVLVGLAAVGLVGLHTRADARDPIR